MTIKARIAEARSDGDRRGAERQDLDLDALVREMGAEGHEARILNISESGFMAESMSGEFEVGSRIWLILPDRERASAVVKWIAGHKLGAQFAEPVDISGLGN